MFVNIDHQVEPAETGPVAEVDEFADPDACKEEDCCVPSTDHYCDVNDDKLVHNSNGGFGSARAPPDLLRVAGRARKLEQ